LNQKRLKNVNDIIDFLRKYKFFLFFKKRLLRKELESRMLDICKKKTF